MRALTTKVLVDAQARERPFALLSRNQSSAPATLEIFTGNLSEVKTLDAITLSDNIRNEEALVLIPYCQLHERHYACIDDGAPLLMMTISRKERMLVTDALQLLPELTLDVLHGGFDWSDAEYASKVSRIIHDEIGAGEGSNFVLKRTFIAEISGSSLGVVLAAFCCLLQHEVVLIGCSWFIPARTPSSVRARSVTSAYATAGP